MPAAVGRSPARVEVAADADGRRLLRRFEAALDARRPVVVLDCGWPPAALNAAREAAAEALLCGRLGEGDLVVHTSGSTGRPRGVVRRVASWAASLAPFTQLTGVGPADTVWLPGPLSSSLYLFGAFHARQVGACLVLRGEPAGAATVAHCVPHQLATVFDQVRAGRLPRLRTLVVAGDRLPAAARLGGEQLGLRLVEYYGAAELSFVAAAADGGPLRPFPGCELQARGGRLWARSPYLCSGYLRAGDRGPLAVDDQGWATVGDLGELGQDGHGVTVTVRGRGDAAVSVAGHTVVVEDLEDTLRRSPGISDAAAAGVSHPLLGQRLVAVLVTDLDDAALRRALADLPAPARPRRWVRVAAVPRTEAGKVDRAAVAQLAHEALARSDGAGASS